MLCRSTAQNRRHAVIYIGGYHNYLKRRWWRILVGSDAAVLAGLLVVVIPVNTVHSKMVYRRPRSKYRARLEGESFHGSQGNEVLARMK